MGENPYGQNRAPNPFRNDILADLGKMAAGYGIIYVLVRVLHLNIPNAALLLFVAPFGLDLVKVLRNYFDYKSYVRDFRDGRPMRKEDFLKEQEAVKRDAAAQASRQNRRK